MQCQFILLLAARCVGHVRGILLAVQLCTALKYVLLPCPHALTCSACAPLRGRRSLIHVGCCWQI